ncbi:MAG: shikimate kinase [Puniceicoccaceae bacterium]
MDANDNRQRLESRLPNLYLIGFMGTGKSVIGRALARHLGLSFIDSDQWIESRDGRGIPQIFEESGEPFFRRLEKEFVETGHPQTGCVVACGGGLAVQPGMLERLESKGVVVALFASPGTILRRVQGNRNRPLLNVENPELRIRSLLAEREPFYRSARIGVMTDFRGIHELRERISALYHERLSEMGRHRGVTVSSEC